MEPIRLGPCALYQGDVLDVLRTLPTGSVHCTVTSPPYFGLRDYGCPGQIGLEKTPQEFVARLVEVFREVRRVLRPDGTLWLNIGDSYSTSPRGNKAPGGGNLTNSNIGSQVEQARWEGARLGVDKSRLPGVKPKDLLGIPWLLAFALRDDGWYLRAECIWCLSGGAWVYARTQKGDMPVMVKDLVRLDPAAVKLWNGVQWTQVLGWNRNPDPENKLEIVLRSGERIGCTGNHVWPTQRGNVRADELRPGDVIETCRLPEPLRQDPPYLHESTMRLIGLYLAEGSRSGDAIQLSLHADESRWLDWIGRVAHHYGGSMTYTLDGGNLNVRLYGRVLNAILDTYVGGATAHDKHLKVAAWSLSNALLTPLAQGYLDGDGHHDQANDRHRLAFCRNYALERDLRTLAARLGATLTLKPVIAFSQWGQHPAFRGEWRWTTNGHHNSKDRGEVMEVRASRARQFWDIGVEDEPHLFALASGVLTHNSKPNVMPESVRDRPSRAHEQVFLLSPSARYFYDADAVVEESSQHPVSAKRRRRADNGAVGTSALRGSKYGQSGKGSNVNFRSDTRNLRSVWKIPSKSYRGAHFATFPPALVEPCVKAGTSARGVCPACGAPWKRVVERQRVATRPGTDSKVYVPDPAKKQDALGDPRLVGFSQRWKESQEIGNRDPERHVTSRQTLGWEQGCKCPAADPVPAVVLDPFAGSGTTLVVAAGLGRQGVGIELNADYLPLARARIVDALGMFATAPLTEEP